MALPLDFTNSDEVITNLTKSLGRLVLDITGIQVVDADSTIPKPEGPYILIDLATLDQLDWATNEEVDSEGVLNTAYNYTASYTLTAYRGKPYLALSRVLQSFGLPYLRERYFPTGSAFAYSSSSTIAKLRVPLNQQMFENRARVLITFNVCFVERDVGVFEDVEAIVIGIETENTSGPPVGLEATPEITSPPGGDDPGLPPKPNPPITYTDKIVSVCMNNENSGY